jgi:hypothetical protein
LFWFCKRHVLQALHPDLRHSTTSSRPDVEHDVELIPLPSTSTSSSAKSEDTSSHARISQYCFSICFEECCILFGLALAQALDLLHVEYALLDSSLLPPSYLLRTFRTCRLHWTVSLTILTSTTLLIIPLFQCLFLTYPSGSRTSYPFLLSPPIFSNFLRQYTLPPKNRSSSLSHHTRFISSFFPKSLSPPLPIPTQANRFPGSPFLACRFLVYYPDSELFKHAFGSGSPWVDHLGDFIRKQFLDRNELNRYNRRKEISDSDLARAQSSLDQIREDLVRRRSELEKRLQSVASGKVDRFNTLPLPS